MLAAAKLDYWPVLQTFRLSEAKLGLEHRSAEWQPADPDRLDLGLRLSREGKTVKADEARAWFHREPS